MDRCREFIVHVKQVVKMGYILHIYEMSLVRPYVCLCTLSDIEENCNTEVNILMCTLGLRTALQHGKRNENALIVIIFSSTRSDIEIWPYHSYRQWYTERSGRQHLVPI